MSDAYAVIGNPIGFSKSPFIHRCFAAATVQDMVYTTIEGPLGQFAATVDAIRFDGGRVMAENVDRVGLVRDVVHNLGCALSGRRVPGAGLWLCRASGPGV